MGLGVLDQKRIEELRRLHMQKQNAKFMSIKPGAALRAGGLSLFPPILPDTAPFSKGISKI